MIMVLCVMAIFTALGFAILLTASVAYSSSQGSLNAERCKIIAISFSDIISEEMLTNETEETGIQKTVHQDMSGQTWRYYREDEAFHNDKDSATRSYKVDSAPSGYDLTVSMYWSPQGDDVINFNDENTFTGSELFITVTCEKGGQTYRAKADYVLKVDTTKTPYEWKWTEEWRK